MWCPCWEPNFDYVLNEPYTKYCRGRKFSWRSQYYTSFVSSEIPPLTSARPWTWAVTAWHWNFISLNPTCSCKRGTKNVGNKRHSNFSKTHPWRFHEHEVERWIREEIAPTEPRSERNWVRFRLNWTSSLLWTCSTCSYLLRESDACWLRCFATRWWQIQRAENKASSGGITQVS